jgi:hypothetical protein
MLAWQGFSMKKGALFQNQGVWFKHPCSVDNAAIATAPIAMQQE